MKPILVIIVLALPIVGCNRQSNSEHSGGFYSAECADANYTVEKVPEELGGLIRKELTEKITHDSIIGKIPYKVSHPVNSDNCETLYDEYNVWAEVKLSTGVETWNLSFKTRKNGKLWCVGCHKSLLHHPPE